MTKIMGKGIRTLRIAKLDQDELLTLNSSSSWIGLVTIGLNQITAVNGFKPRGLNLEEDYAF